MISINKNTNIYILCPANLSTGGPEELHQLGAQLIATGKNVFMCYDQYNSEGFKTPVHDNYKKYNVPFCLEIENTKDNIVIFPETYSYKLWDKEFSKTQRAVWWLSVIFYLKTLENTQLRFKKKQFYSIKKFFRKYPIPTIKRLKEPGISHIAHSFFSLDFLKNNGIQPIGQISGYMDEVFHLESNWREQKEDIVIYNAIKNGEFLNKIIQRTPQLKWQPLQQMTLDEIADWMKKAKVYIDFGFHPGREKMPREAVLLNCCLIAGKQGSAKYKEDMPISDDYHFEDTEENLPHIISKIKDCFLNFDERIKDFTDYKILISNEKKLFQESVNFVFNTNKNI